MSNTVRNILIEAIRKTNVISEDGECFKDIEKAVDKMLTNLVFDSKRYEVNSNGYMNCYMGLDEVEYGDLVKFDELQEALTKLRDIK